MSISSIMNIGVSGLQTAQDQLRVVSDNVSNVNTPGYIRKVASQKAVSIGGVGMGVASGTVTLAADKYLQAASLRASSGSAQADASYDLLDQLQSQFGDITDTNNLFNQAGTVLSSISQTAEDPLSSAGRQQVVSNLASFLSEGSRISDKIQSIRGDADTRIATDVKSVNDLLKNITDLNASISSATVAGQDATGAQTTQSGYIDQLSKLIDVSTSQNANGSVTVRTASGMFLAGDNHVSLSYQPSSGVNSTTSFNAIVVTGANGEKRDFADNLGGGEIKGLLDVRDTSAPAINDQLNAYINQFSEQMNAAHNANSAVPAPASLTGKNTSLSQTEALSGFQGTTNLVTLDTSGNITHTLQLAFDPSGSGDGSYTLDGTGTGTFSAASFASDITTAFGGSSVATADFTNGVLSLTASGSGGNNGVAIVDDANNPSLKSGQGFSQYFGLNDLVTSSAPTNFQTGLTATSNAGFTSGSVNFQLKSANGATLNTINFAMPSSGDMSNLVSQLNDTNTGVGRYGTFSLDGAGALTFKGFGSPANSLGITDDSTSRNGTGATFSQFFGVGGTQGKIASSLSVNSLINSNAANLALAHVDLTTTGGLNALTTGDGSGGQAMAAITSKTVTFTRAGFNSGGPTTLQRYASDLAGQVGNLAANAKTNKDSAAALLTEATSRRSAYEGVNLDEELVNLTTYQQGYSAAGRLVQAAKDMYDVLLNMI